jgi:GntR family transcriptional regulator, phosphonate transport system regulatory protein
MTVSAEPLWAQIAASLRADLASHLPPGAKLPTEAQLAARFGVNRHTVRRAVAALAAEGRVHARRGAGVFAAMQPVEYPLSRRTRFHAAVSATGRVPGRRILAMQPGTADTAIATHLTLAPGAPILRLEGVSLSDGTVMGHFTSVFPLARLPGLPDALIQHDSITTALATCGITDYTRAWTRLSATRADALLAGHLRLAAGDPVMRSEALNLDAQGQPIEYGITHFAGDRITLLVTPE